MVFPSRMFPGYHLCTLSQSLCTLQMQTFCSHIEPDIALKSMSLSEPEPEARVESSTRDQRCYIEINGLVFQAPRELSHFPGARSSPIPHFRNTVVFNQLLSTLPHLRHTHNVALRTRDMHITFVRMLELQRLAEGKSGGLAVIVHIQT